MTFGFDNYCMPARVYDLDGETERRLGFDKGLTLALVSSGRAGFYQGEDAALAGAGSFVLAAGQVSFAPAEECHAVGAALVGAAAEELARGLAAPLLLGSAAAPGAAELLFRLVEAPLPASEASATAYGLLCRLAAADTSRSALPPLVGAAVALIRSHYGEVYGVEELAKELNVSKSHLVRVFSAATGLPPGRYLTSVRVEAAKRLLLHREYTLETVAMLCGFSGANYFCKVFKKQTGLSPAAWRERSAPAPAAGPGQDEWENRLYL